jgi:hypothetical protein
VAVGLGCGGVGAPIRPSLDPFCATQTAQVPLGVALADVEAPGRAPPSGDALAVTAAGVTRWGQPVDPGAIGPAVLYVDANAPVERVLEALAAAPGAPAIARSRDEWTLPAYADPLAAQQLELTLTALDPAQRAMVLASCARAASGRSARSRARSRRRGASCWRWGWRRRCRRAR